MIISTPFFLEIDSPTSEPTTEPTRPPTIAPICSEVSPSPPAAAGGDGETSEQIGAIVGGLVGSVVGSEVGESISRKKGVEIIIKLDSNNREVAIVQEASEDEAQEVKAGDKVRIIRSAGRSRVVPYN